VVTLKKIRVAFAATTTVAGFAVWQALRLVALFAVAATLLVVSIAGADAATRGQVTLGLRVTGVGGAVTATPSGVLSSCSATRCYFRFDPGTPITLAASVSEPRSRFAEWRGACSGSQTTCTLIMSESKSLTAAFSPVPLYIDPTPGKGWVEVRPSGAPCGTGCTEFAYGTGVTLNARACCGYQFDSWSGGCSSVRSSGCRFDMYTLEETTPIFIKCDGGECTNTSEGPLSREVKATLTVYGTGRVGINGKDCRGPNRRCTFSFTRGRPVALRAYDATFVRWGGTNCSGSSPRCQFAAFNDPYGNPPRIYATFDP
jgi:hypothetical protein